MPTPPANRPHGTGDRNEEHIAEVDKHLQDRRQEREEKESEQAPANRNNSQGYTHR